MEFRSALALRRHKMAGSGNKLQPVYIEPMKDAMFHLDRWEVDWLNDVDWTLADWHRYRG